MTRERLAWLPWSAALVAMLFYLSQRNEVACRAHDANGGRILASVVASLAAAGVGVRLWDRGNVAIYLALGVGVVSFMVMGMIGTMIWVSNCGA